MNIRSEFSTLVVEKEGHVPDFATYLVERELLDPTKLNLFRSDEPVIQTPC